MPSYLLCLLAFLLNAGIPSAAERDKEFELVNFRTADGGQIEASWFKAGGKRAVIFAHGAVFNKESWHPMAKRLQEAGVSALSLDFRGYGNSKGGNTDEKAHDILGAVAYLEEQGYSDIVIIGGSMGGGAVLRALARTENPNITKAVILAADGPPIQSAGIEKLFIVSQGDRIASRVKALCDASSEPKELTVLPGDAHAQHIFATEHGQELADLLVKSVKN